MGIIIYPSQYDAMENLSNEQIGQITRKLCEKFFRDNDYVCDDKLADGIAKSFIPNVESAERRHKACVENGKKGGAPNGNQNARKNNQKQPKNNQRVEASCYSENNLKQPKNNQSDDDKNNQKQPKNNHEKEIEKEREIENENISSDKSSDIDSSVISCIDTNNNSSTIEEKENIKEKEDNVISIKETNNSFSSSLEYTDEELENGLAVIQNEKHSINKIPNFNYTPEKKEDTVIGMKIAFASEFNREQHIEYLQNLKVTRLDGLDISELISNNAIEIGKCYAKHGIEIYGFRDNIDFQDAFIYIIKTNNITPTYFDIA